MDEELKLFLEDVNDQIENLEEGLVSLEERSDPQILNTVFRAAHTLKGISATFGAQKMNALTHQMESVLQKIRDGGYDIQQELITTLLSCADVLKQLRDDIENNKESAVDTQPLIARLEQFLGREKKPAAPPSSSPSPAPAATAPPEKETKPERPAQVFQAPVMDEEERKLFLEDVNDQIENLEEGLVSLEERKDPQVLNTLFRAAHTLKGVSATFGAQKMNALTHRMESVFQKIRDEGREVESGLVTLLLACVDALKTLKRGVEEDKESFADVGTLVEKLKGFEKGEAVRAEEGKSQPLKEETAEITEKKIPLETAIEDVQTLKVAVTLKEDTPLPSARLLLIFQELKANARVMEMSPAEEKLLKEDCFSGFALLKTAEKEEGIRKQLSSFTEIKSIQVDIPPVGVPAVPAAARADDLSLKGKKTIRLDMERVEALMNITSELVIEKNRLLQISQLFIKEEYEQRAEIKALLETKEQLDKKISFLQDEMLKVRMISLDALFKKFPRAVRDAAVRAGKEVKFTITGASVELDKTVIDELSDPLIHLLRNAVDHGIPKKGEIILSARQAEGNVFIEVSDDGGGIDLEKVRKKALEKKMMDEEQLKKLSDKEALELIFMPGFSTKENVSDLSGRGVGLDVVRENIKKIHGSVDVQTENGKGTKFTLKIPLTLAIIKALLVLSSGQKFAIPLSSVHEIVQVGQEDIQTVKTKEAVLLRGNVLPLFRLSRLLDFSESGHEERFRKVVVVSYLERKVGFVIDALLGEQEIVVYTLGKFIGEVPGISGATIDAEGRVALILDVPSLVTSTL